MDISATYFFNTKAAMDFGVDAAVILSSFYHWQMKNQSERRNYHDGRYWTYNSKKAMKRYFPWMSERQIGYVLDKLSDGGVIVKGNFNKSALDRTLWYSVTEKGVKYFMTQAEENFTSFDDLPDDDFPDEELSDASDEIDTIHCTNLYNGANKNVRPIPSINHTSNKPLYTPVNKKKEKENTEKKQKKDLRSDERGGVSSSSSFSYEDFEKFYKAYPKHKSRATAETAFFKIKGVDLNVILKAVEEQKKTDQWQKQGGQFVPYPATWLNSRGWENEVKPNEYANGQVPAGTVFKEYPPDSGNMLPAEIVATFRSRELQCADDERVPYKNFSIPKGVLELYQQAITMGKKGG